MNNTDKQVTFGTMKGSRMRNTNDLSDGQHGLPKNTARVFVYIQMKTHTVNFKVNGFHNKK